MALHQFEVVFFLLIASLVTVSGNGQSWSHHTYKDDPYTLVCESDTRVPSSGDVLTWKRDGMGENETVANDGHFELRAKNGVDNMELFVKKVTDETKGIYVCHIHNASGELWESVVLGLNVGKHMYHDKMDKYREGIIIGVIAAGSVFFAIISVCILDHFRYLSEDSLEKRRQRKEERLSRKHTKFGVSNNSFINGVGEIPGADKFAATPM